MSWSRSFAVGIASLALMSAGLPVRDARAATVSYVGTTGVSPYLSASPYTFPAVTLPKFDIPGQCLVSVCVRLDAGTAGFASFENYENVPKRVNVTWSAQFNLLRPSLTPLLTVAPTAFTSDSVTSFDGSVDYAGTSGLTHSGLSAAAADSVCLSIPADVALFNGAGTIALPITAANISTQSGANSWSFGIQGNAAVKVTYTYVDCSTPVKPTTWGALKSTYR